MKERILDIGVGQGGTYLTGITPDSGYCGVDVNRGDLAILKSRTPSIETIQASGESLPFQNAAFNKIVILFPSGDLLAPGLQSHIPYPPESNRKPIEAKGKSWYEEFARILKPQGKLLLYGDWILLADEIILQELHKPFFVSINKQELTDSDLIALGTRASCQVSQRRANDLETHAYRFTFQKCKIG